VRRRHANASAGPLRSPDNALAVLVAFIPFFAVKELGRVLGEKRMWELFLRKGTTTLIVGGEVLWGEAPRGAQ
jgi:hypothetical protein